MSNENDGACCAHLCVEWLPVKHGPCTFSDRWRCKDCEHEFVPFGRFSALAADLARVTAERDAIKEQIADVAYAEVLNNQRMRAAEADRDRAREALIGARDTLREIEPIVKHEYSLNRIRISERECTAALAPAQDTLIKDSHCQFCGGVGCIRCDARKL